MPGSSPRPRSGQIVSALLGMLAVAVVAGVMVAVAVTPAIALTGGSAKGGIGLFSEIPPDLTIASLDQKSEIYAKRNGRDVLIASFYAQDREVVGWKQISSVVKNAAIAGEDVRFYQHGGVDPVGIVRATLANLAGKNLQGASTITQQYIKNVCVQEAENQTSQAAVDKAYAVCTDASIGRKLREARYAIALEKRYSKDDILLGYLNIAGFGGRVYGVESAAKYYFGTTAAKLSVAQAASLMAIVNNPQALRLDDKANYARNKDRRDYILGVELRNGLITKAQHDAAVATPIAPKITQTTTGCQAAGAAGFFCDYVVKTVLADAAFGKTAAERNVNLQRSGWKIYTTLDLGLEAKAQTAMNTWVPKSSQLFNVGGAAVSVEVGTGRIISMVQNKDYDPTGGTSPSSSAVNYSANYALGQSNGWQPGSTFKVFTLLDWLAKGHTLNELVDASPGSRPASSFTVCGAPYQGDPYDVINDAPGEGGQQSVLQATAQSINGAFVSMAQQLDLCDIQNTAKALGVTPATGPDYPPIVAPMVVGGSYGVSPVSIAGAYAAIANGGVFCKPIAIEKVVRTDGSNLPVPGADCKQAIDKGVADAAVAAMRGVFQGGTAGGDNTADGLYEFGKTGTTNNAWDTWMTGSTSKVTTSVWVGNNGQLRNNPKQSLRLTAFPNPCYTSGGGQAAVARHCVWKDIQTAANAQYGGATSWAQPDPKYLYGAPVQQQAPTAAGSVPDVSGLPKDQAAQAMVAAGFSWAYGPDVPSSQPAGLVAATEPVAGTPAPPGTQVVIHGSTGSTG